MHTVSNLPPPAGGSQRASATIPVYVLALRKLKMGILLVTDFTPNRDSVYANGSLSRVPTQFSVDGQPLPKDQVFSISVSGNRVMDVVEKLKMSAPLPIFDMNDDRNCDVSQLGILALANFNVQEYQGHQEGFLRSIVTLNRMSQQLDHVTEQMQGAGFQAFMSRLAGRMTVQLYDVICRSFPVERFVERAAVRNVRPKKEIAEPRPEPLKTQSPVRNRLPASELFYQPQHTQPADSAVGTPRPTQVFQRPNPDISGHLAENSSNPEKSPSFDPVRGHHQVAQTQAPPRPQHVRYSVHRLHYINSVQLQGLKIEHIETHTSFEVAAAIGPIEPSPEDIFVKPYGKTIRVAPFSVFLGDVPIRLLSPAEACTFFGVDEVEILIHHIQEYSRNLRRLSGHNVKIRVERRVCRLANAYELPYWGFLSCMQDLLLQVPQTPAPVHPS